MVHKVVKRLPATEVKAHLGRIVHDVATTGTPVVIQTRGEDQAVIISLRDFHTLWPTEAAMSAPMRHRVRAALRAADLLSEPTAQEVAAVQAFEATHAPADQQRMLARWRQWQLSPALPAISPIALCTSGSAWQIRLISGKSPPFSAKFSTRLLAKKSRWRVSVKRRPI